MQFVKKVPYYIQNLCMNLSFISLPHSGVSLCCPSVGIVGRRLYSFPAEPFYFGAPMTTVVQFLDEFHCDALISGWGFVGQTTASPVAKVG